MVFSYVRNQTHQRHRFVSLDALLHPSHIGLMEITSSLLDNSSLIVWSICVVIIEVPFGNHVLVAHLKVHTSSRLGLLAEHNRILVVYIQRQESAM